MVTASSTSKQRRFSTAAAIPHTKAPTATHCQHLPVSPTPARTEASAAKRDYATTAPVLKDSLGGSAELPPLTVTLGMERRTRESNPDGDDKPWCFIKKNDKLQWEYCNVKTCPEGTVTPPIGRDASPQFSQCGIPGVISKIILGHEVLPGYIPWQVSVQDIKPGDTSFTHNCGGILIGSCWVLTAAHCIKDVEYQVVLGGVNKDRAEEEDQIIPVIQTIKHEDYRGTEDALYNDIALLQLKAMDGPHCAKETKFVRTACLPDRRFPAGHECIISGWGRTETRMSSAKLLHARVLLISDKVCSTPEVYGDFLGDNMMCAGTLKGGVDSCKGDSGGPMTCRQNSTNYISGVVSWGDGCGKKNKPGVYTNVNKFVDWIKSKINCTVTPPIGRDASPQFSQCGIPGVISKIILGHEVLPGYIPWQVSVQDIKPGDTSFTHNCGGILIGSCWVLTAAHCIKDVEYQVVLGGVNKDRAEEEDQIIPVIQTIKHEDYRGTEDALYNDIALLQLKAMDGPHCAKETKFVRTACLPDRRFPAGHECIISGWGRTETRMSSAKLLHARVLLISDKVCSTPEVYGDFLGDNMMCAGTLKGGVDSCKGDSGGPMTCRQNSTNYISGVVSWGDGCGKKNKPGVYTNVNKFVDWIKSKIN